MKLLFVHQKLGEFGGAETNIRVCAAELKNRGYNLGLMYQETTGRNETQWREIFGDCFGPAANTSSYEFVRSVLHRFEPQVIYLHNVANLEWLEALLDSGVPVVRMVHDHALYCMRGYKYNYFTRHICTRAFSPFCVFPCLASLARNPNGPLPVKWVSYSAKKKEISLNLRCHHIVVYSDYLKKELVRNGFQADKIDLCIPIRLENEPGKVSSFSSRNLILFAGQLIRGKGVDILLHALARVRTHFECDIFGDGSHRKQCEQLCARLGLETRVRFWGYVLPGELPRFYQDASIFVMGSLWPEPFGMAGPEAMRYGLPVVAFDAGGIREWLADGENGFLIPWKNVDLFAARLDQLLRDKQLARQLGRNGFATVQRYDSCRQIDKLEQVFHQVARLRRAPTRTAHTSLSHSPVYE